MKRQELDDLLVDYLYDELDADTARRVEAALHSHPDLMEEVQAHREIRGFMARLEDQPVPDGLLGSVMAEARTVARAAAAPEETWLDRILGWALQPVVAVAALFVLVGTMGWFLTLDESAPPTAAPGLVLAERTAAHGHDEPGAGAMPEAGGKAPGTEKERASASPVEDPDAELLAAVPNEQAPAAPDPQAPEVLGETRPVAEGVVARLVEVDDPKRLTQPARREEGAQSPSKNAMAPVDLASNERLPDAKNTLRNIALRKEPPSGEDQLLWEARQRLEDRRDVSRSEAQPEMHGKQIADARAPYAARTRGRAQRAGPTMAPQMAEDEAPSMVPSMAPSMQSSSLDAAPAVVSPPPVEASASIAGVKEIAAAGDQQGVRHPLCEMPRRQWVACAQEAKRQSGLCQTDCTKLTEECRRGTSKKSHEVCVQKGQRCTSQCTNHEWSQCSDLNRALTACAGSEQEKRLTEQRRTLQVVAAVVEGDCESSHLLRVARRRRGILRTCFEAARLKDPDVGGTARVAFTIDRRGKPKSMVTTTTASANPAKNCLERVLRRMRFEKPWKGTCKALVEVTYNLPREQDPGRRDSQPASEAAPAPQDP